MRNNSVLLILSLFMLIGCGDHETSNTAKPLATVYDQSLYASDLAYVIPFGYSGEDSTALANNYIDKWIKKQLIVKKAEENLNEELKEVDKLVESYRSSLLVYHYKQQFIKEKMDTSVTADEALQYYSEHSFDFRLNKTAVQANYVCIGQKDPELYKVRNWLKYDNDGDIHNLLKYTSENDLPNYLGEGWFYMDDLQSRIPLNINYDTEAFLKYNQFYEFRDSASIYYVRFYDYRLKGDISPLNLVRPELNTIIMNKKKQELLIELENDLYQSWIKQNDNNKY